MGRKEHPCQARHPNPSSWPSIVALANKAGWVVAPASKYPERFKDKMWLQSKFLASGAPKDMLPIQTNYLPHHWE